MPGSAWSLPPALVARAYGESGAARWSLSREALAAALTTSATKAFEGRVPSGGDLDRYISSLHLEDLALAVACAEGVDAAWEHFVSEHRPALLRAADAIDTTGGARELADSLYADLYGLGDDRGTRQSLFRYFHGRSKLGTWLRAVLSQRHVDRLRAGRKFDPLPDDPGTLPAAEPERASDPERARYESVMQHALARAIAGLPARDRLRLSCYYAQRMTLAAIGRMLKEHEATVSRHLTHTREVIRDAVWARLRDDHGMDDGAIAECLSMVVADAGTLDVASLMGAPVRKKSQPDRSRE